MARKSFSNTKLSLWRPQLTEAEVSAPESAAIVLGGQEVTIYEMTLSSAQGVLSIVLPHLRSLLNSLSGGMRDENLSLLRTATEQVGDGDISSAVDALREQAATRGLTSFLPDSLMDALMELPVDLIDLLARLINISEDDEELMNFMRNSVRISELPDLFGVIGELNDFSSLFNRIITSFRRIAKNYGMTFPEAEVKRAEVAEGDIANIEEEVEEGSSIVV